MALPLDPVLDAKAASCKHVLYNSSSVMLDDIKKKKKQNSAKQTFGQRVGSIMLQ